MRILTLLLASLLAAGCRGSGPAAVSSTPPAEHEHHPAGVVEITPEQIAELGIEITPVVKGEGQTTGVRPGRIEADPDGRVVLSSQVSGTLSRFYVQVGATVKAGATVAVINSPEVTALQADYHEAEVEAELAAKELENKRSLLQVSDDIQRPIETARLEVAQARSRVEAAEARLKSSVLKNERLETLLKDGIAARQQVEESRADRKALEAELQEARTALRIAGDHLEREQRVSSSDLRAKAETFPAEARLARASESMRHARERLRQVGASPEAHDGTVVLSTPITGTVVERPLSVGELVSPGQTVASVVDSTSMWVWVELQPADLELVKVGDPIRMSLVERPDITEQGRLDYLAPQMEETTQTVKARVVLRNPREEFRLGGFVDVRVRAGGEGEEVPAVPQRSVQFVEGNTVVYLRSQDRFVRTVVELGPEIGESLVTARGVKVGDEVVAEGAERLKSLDLSETIGGHHH